MNRRLWVRLREKGRKRHAMPCNHNLDLTLISTARACATISKRCSIKRINVKDSRSVDGPSGVAPNGVQRRIVAAPIDVRMDLPPPLLVVLVGLGAGVVGVVEP